MAEQGRSPRSAKDTSYYAKRIASLIDLMIEKGLVSQEEISKVVEEFDKPRVSIGARAVARAWRDPEFKARLLADATKVFAELGVDISPEKIVVLENTERVHHLAVCTLCSCYDRTVLGEPPGWYKSLEFRARAVSEPRGVLREFRVRLASDQEVRVHDVTADVSYLVLPLPPPGAENLTEDELVRVVTPDCMIGTGEVRPPP